MLALLKLLQSLVKTLHSEGTPTQIGLGVALGAALGLTPIANAHNFLVVLLLAVLNVSFGAGMLAWAVFVPIWLGSQYAVVRYRATIGERFQQSHLYKVFSASQLYNVYRWFRP